MATRILQAAPIAGAILAFCLAGGAYATSPTLDTNQTYRGSVNRILNDVTSGEVIYTVPPNRGFVLTDVIITNPATGTDGLYTIFKAPNSSCAGIPFDSGKLGLVIVGRGTTVHFPFVTGIRFTSGSLICVYDSFNTGSNWTINGILYE